MALVAAGFCAGVPRYVHAQEAAAAGAPTPDKTQLTKPANKKRAKEKAKAAELHAVVVHGFRQAVQKSISIKRYSADTVEAISAEDLGKLPDTSIAESLARLPGLTAQEVNGRAQSISIRGLGPDFSTALLNGREQVSTGDDRGVEFDQYPADLLGSVVVYKTPDPTLIGAGLAGTVDLRTIRPLEYGHRAVSLNGRYEFNGKPALNPDGINKGYRIEGTYIDQFDDDKLGVTLGVSGQRTPSQIQAFNSWGHAVSNGVILPGGAKPFAETDMLKRIAGIATVEYKPNANFHTTLDLSYSHFDDKLIKRGVELPLGFAGVPTSNLVVRNGFAVSGVFDGVKGVMRNDLDRRFAQLYTAGLNQKIRLTDRWGFEADISYSRANRQDLNLESYSGTGPAGQGATDTLGFRVKPDGAVVFSPSLNYADLNQFVLTDPQGWGAGSGVTQAGFINQPRTVDWLTHWKFDMDRTMDTPVFSKVTFGVDLSRRDKSRDILQEFLTLPNGATSAPIPQQYLLSNATSIDGFFGIPAHINYDPLGLLNNGAYVPVPVQLSSFSVPQSWQLREDVVTPFFKFDVNSHVGPYPLTGNVGLQVVYTNQGSIGSTILNPQGAAGGSGATSGHFVRVAGGAKYTRVLPSLNLAVDLPDQVQARFGVSRVMARPRPDQLNASLSLGTDFTHLTSTDPNQAFFSESGGNPELKPYMATAVDLSVAKYLGPSNQGYVQLALFYKDLNDYVNPSDSHLADFSQFVSSTLTPAQQQQLGTTMGVVSAPSNNGSGDIKGVEFTLSIPTELYTSVPVLKDFGFISTADYVDSRVQFGNDPEAVTVPGLSRWVINSTIYFDQGGFDARISHRYRSKFLSEIFGISATRVFREAKAMSIFDAQLSYSFRHYQGPIHGLSVVFQALNLTDEPFITFENKDPRQVVDLQKFGRTFLAGFLYHF